MANKVLIYIHGKGGRSEDSEYYKPLFPEYDVMGFDYKSDNPWEAEAEYRNYFTSLSEAEKGVSEGSIGAYVIIPAKFSSNVITLNQKPEASELDYKISKKYSRCQDISG